MRRAFTTSLIAVGLLVIAIGCSSGGDLTRPETQSQFGVRMAKMNLWREAMFRFRRAVEIDPSDAQARNNLAVALEANGDFDAAAKEYREALRLDRSNQHIQKNYSRFVEFTTKARKREAGAVTTTTGTATETAPPAPPLPIPTKAVPTESTSTGDRTTTNPPGGSR